jgi:hypothetical protein
MGAAGAIVMSFFGAVFASLALSTQFGQTGAVLALPFLVFAAIAVSAVLHPRRVAPTFMRAKHTDRVVMWSSAVEGVAIFIAVNLLVNLGHRELLLPTIALIVGLHFLPMAYALAFRPFYGLGGVILLAAALGFMLKQPAGGSIAGLVSAGALWVAAIFALLREEQWPGLKDEEYSINRRMT